MGFFDNLTRRGFFGSVLAFYTIAKASPSSGQYTVTEWDSEFNFAIVPDQFKAGVQNALLTAGRNRVELEKAILNFRDDQSKLEAICFLVQETPFRISQIFPGNDWNSIPTETIDAKVIKARYLIEDVEYAFKAVDMFPWTKELYSRDKDTFFRQVLPYRVGTGRLDQLGGLPIHWRAFFLDERVYNLIKRRLSLTTSFKVIQERLLSLSDQYQKAGSLEEKRRVMKDLIAFIDIDVFYKGEGVRYYSRGPQELDLYTFLTSGDKEKRRGGRCTDLDSVLRMALMSYGIPVTATRFIAWPKGDSNHEIVSGDILGEQIGMSAITSDRVHEEYFWFRPNAVAKVYEERIGDWSQASEVTMNLRIGEKLPWHISFYLGTRPMIDVTERYTQHLTDLYYHGLRKNSLVYLGVLNNSSDPDLLKQDQSNLRLAAVAAERADSSGNVTFRKVGSEDIIYFSYYFETDGSVTFFDGPFILHKDGKREYISGEKDGREHHVVQFGSRISSPVNPKEYSLMAYSDGDWVEKQKFRNNQDGTFTLDQIQEDALYILKDLKDDMFMRPFIFRKDSGITTY